MGTYKKRLHASERRYDNLTPLNDSRVERSDKRNVRESWEANSAMLADNAFADDVVTDDDGGKYYTRQTIVESRLGNYA